MRASERDEIVEVLDDNSTKAVFGQMIYGLRMLLKTSLVGAYSWAMYERTGEASCL